MLNQSKLQAGKTCGSNMAYTLATILALTAVATVDKENGPVPSLAAPQGFCESN